MKKDNMNKLINRAFLRANPLKTVSLWLLFGLGICATGAAAYEVNSIAKQEKKSFTTVASERWGNISFTVLASWIMVLVSAGFVFDTEKERQTANYILKRKIRSIAAKNKEMMVYKDEQAMQDLGDLLVANMTKQEKTAVIKIARDFARKVSVFDRMCDIEPDKIDKMVAIQEIEKIIDGVLKRNPELVDIFTENNSPFFVSVSEKQYN